MFSGTNNELNFKVHGYRFTRGISGVYLFIFFAFSFFPIFFSFQFLSCFVFYLIVSLVLFCFSGFFFFLCVCVIYPYLVLFLMLLFILFIVYLSEQGRIVHYIHLLKQITYLSNMIQTLLGDTGEVSGPKTYEMDTAPFLP